MEREEQKAAESAAFWKGLFGDDRATEFLAISFPCERGFQALLFAGRHIESMTFDFTDDVFLLNLAFETTQRALKRFAVAEFDFCH